MWSLRSALAVVIGAVPALNVAAQRPPNFVVILADDLGFADFGCFGHPTIRTPNIDRLAAEGLRFTQFYSVDSVCTPSRAALLTGRQPVRTGLWGDRTRVLFHNSVGGLPADEVTLAEALDIAGYRSVCVGKWHLGHLPQYLPHRHGFAWWYGVPYSNDMAPLVPPRGEPQIEWWNLPLMDNDTILEQPADQHTLTQRYTQRAVQFLDSVPRGQKFFLYLSHTAPHVPLFASARFEDSSRRGRYGDVVEELDWSVGEVIAALQRNGLDQDTLVLLTSDNGPWLIMGTDGGSAGLLRDGKGTTYEGGLRVPAIAWWPGRIAPGTTFEFATLLDVLPTFLRLAQAPLPNRQLDGYDISPVLFGTGPSPRTHCFFHRGSQIYAARVGQYKVHFLTQSGYGPDPPLAHNPPLMYDVEVDPSETKDVWKQHPATISLVSDLLADYLGGLSIRPSELDRR